MNKAFVILRDSLLELCVGVGLIAAQKVSAVMDAIAHFPRELHALMASYVGDDASGDPLRALAGDAEDWVVCVRRRYDGSTFTTTFCNGLLHSRRDEPALHVVDGDQWTSRWFCRNRPHRDGDRPAVASTSGYQEWWRHGRLHRDGDQPAILKTYLRMWYRDGEVHRGGGKPAVTWEGRPDFNEWWLHGLRQPDPRLRPRQRGHGRNRYRK